jgi:Nucleotidyl transferase AbiEii toxin, Type IV TA system
LTDVQFNERVSAIAQALDVPVERARVIISSAIVAQMLPDGAVVKGGISVKLRLGEVGTRATRDIDLTVRDRANFLGELNQRLEIGWGTVPASKGALRRNPDAPPRVAFTGKARPGRQAHPDGVPTAYLADPYEVTLNFLDKPWKKVPVDVGHDEIGGIECADFPTEVAAQITAIGRVLGFGELAPVALMSLAQTIAQKIHAATQPASQRAHDLVDLQLLWHDATVEQGLDLRGLANQCRRTFAYRKVHAWPPTAAMPELLEAAYQAAKPEPTSVLAETLAQACAWLNARIEEIHAH